MPKEKPLTLEAIRKQQSINCSTDLLGYTSIDDDATAAIADYFAKNPEEDELYLDGLTYLSAKSAESLAKCRGVISLNGLTLISAPVAEALSQLQNGSLSLNGISSLEDETARPFAAFVAQDHGFLSFDVLKSVSDSAGVALAKASGALSLCGLDSVSDAVAQALSKHKGKVFITGLTSLAHRGLANKIAESGIENEIQLLRLTEITHEAADALFRTNAKLLITANNLKTLTHLGLARKLAVDSGDKDLVAVTSLSASDAEKLNTHEGNLDFTRLTSLSEKSAEGVAAHAGHLFFDLPISMPGEAAEALSKHDGPITFFNMPTLSNSTAEGLSHFKGTLTIFGLRELSDPAAEALSRHQGTLELPWLASLSPVAAKALRKHVGQLVLPPALSAQVSAAGSDGE